MEGLDDFAGFGVVAGGRGGAAFGRGGGVEMVFGCADGGWEGDVVRGVGKICGFLWWS